MTELIYKARGNCLAHIEKEADEIGADAVIGVKVYIYEIGNGFVEVMAIGTAVKKMTGLSTHSPALIPQAIIRDRSTFFDQNPGDNCKVRADLIDPLCSSPFVQQSGWPLVSPPAAAGLPVAPLPVGAQPKVGRVVSGSVFTAPMIQRLTSRSISWWIR